MQEANRLPGAALRLRDAIAATSKLAVATVVEDGRPSPGPPGATDIDGARLQIHSVLFGGAIEGSATLCYSYRSFPAGAAEARLEPGRRYILFCKELAPGALQALKALPATDENVRVVTAAVREAPVVA